MKPTHRAIVFLQQARDIIEEEAHHTGPENLDRKMDLQDISDDLGTVLYNLESMDGTP